jgi:acyl carrier protein
MNSEPLQKAVLDALTSIAPEIEPESIAPDKPLRDQVDLDSADWLNFLVALKERTGIEIPDADVARLTTLRKLLDYCDAHRPAPR